MEDRYGHYKALKFGRPRPRVLEMILSKPGKLNALDADGHRELAEVWRDVDRDPDTSVALLRGDGGVFSAGGDLGMIEVMARDWATRTRVWKEASDLVYNVINCTKPIVAAIEGPCVGAGLAAAMLADISVAGRKARIIDGHTRLGVAAGDHSAIVWPLLCGMAKAKYYLLLCDTLTGEEAERIGLVSLVADDGKVVEMALGAAERLRDMPPAADPLDQARAQQLAAPGGAHLRRLARHGIHGLLGARGAGRPGGAAPEAPPHVRSEGPVLARRPRIEWKPARGTRAQRAAFTRRWRRARIAASAPPPPPKRLL